MEKGENPEWLNKNNKHATIVHMQYADAKNDNAVNIERIKLKS